VSFSCGSTLNVVVAAPLQPKLPTELRRPSAGTFSVTDTPSP
jgi:hypothetical protein